MYRQRKKNATQGMTLVEILIVMLLLIVVVVGFMGVFIVSFELSEYSRHVVVALNDASSVLETMRNTPFTSLLAFFPNDVAVPGLPLTLPSETVVVKYTSANSEVVTANVVVSWTERSRNVQEVITITTTLTTR